MAIKAVGKINKGTEPATLSIGNAKHLPERIAALSPRSQRFIPPSLEIHHVNRMSARVIEGADGDVAFDFSFGGIHVVVYPNENDFIISTKLAAVVDILNDKAT